jgi:hypothetical protein
MVAATRVQNSTRRRNSGEGRERAAGGASAAAVNSDMDTLAFERGAVGYIGWNMASP